MILRHLEYLDALARERHFARAAAACGVSQPTLSAAIRELEAELDVLIVERGQRFRALTPEGERAVAWARRILADREAMLQEVALSKGSLAGRLTLGVIPTALASLGLLTRSLRARHPQVALTVLSLSSIDIQRGLDAFDLEAGVTYLDNEPLLRVRSLPLYRERYFLVTGEAAHFPRRRSVTWAEAASLPLCLLTPDMQNRRIVDAAFRAAGAAPSPAVETNSILALYTHVRAGLATVLTQASLHLLGQPAWLRALPLNKPAPRRMIGLVYPEQDPLQPAARALVAIAATLDLEAELERALPR